MLTERSDMKTIKKPIFSLINKGGSQKSLIELDSNTLNNNGNPKRRIERNFTSRIAHGENAPAWEGGFQVHIQRTHMQVPNIPTCSGSLIRSNWILTTASCLFLPHTLNKPDTYSLTAGRLDRRNANTGQVIEINRNEYTTQNLIHYPDGSWNPALVFQWDTIVSKGNDIGIINLPAGRSFTLHMPNIWTIEINEEKSNDYLIRLSQEAGVDVTILGWGFTDQAEQNSPQLQVGRTAFVNKTDVRVNNQVPYVGLLQAEPSDLTPNFNSWACEGDFGGPAVMHLRGRAHLVGLLSFTLNMPPCNIQPNNVHNFYTSVYIYANWINSVLPGNSSITQSRLFKFSKTIVPFGEYEIF